MFIVDIITLGVNFMTNKVHSFLSSYDAKPPVCPPYFGGLRNKSGDTPESPGRREVS